MSKVYLGFDFGLRRIGVAVGQDITMTAAPLCTLNAKNGNPDWDTIEKLIHEWRPNDLIIGIPLNMDGSEMPVTKPARRFAKQLHSHFDIPVHTTDERLTTKAAREEVYGRGGSKALRKKAIDEVAAQLILETWMHS